MSTTEKRQSGEVSVVVSSVLLCARRFNLWPVESGDEVNEVAVVVFRLLS